MATLDDKRFDVKMKLRFVHKYNKASAYNQIGDTDLIDLEENIAPLVLPYDHDELAKRFDFLMYAIMFAYLKGQLASKQIVKVVNTAKNLSKIGNIEKVKRQAEVINQVQDEGFWQDAGVHDMEKVRAALRDLIQYIESSKQKDYYTNFTDEIMGIIENTDIVQTVNLKNYREKVNHYLKGHKDDLVIYKLRHGKALGEETFGT